MDKMHLWSHPFLKCTMDYIHHSIKHEELDEWMGPKVDLLPYTLVISGQAMDV